MEIEYRYKNSKTLRTKFFKEHTDYIEWLDNFGDFVNYIKSITLDNEAEFFKWFYSKPWKTFPTLEDGYDFWKHYEVLK